MTGLDLIVPFSNIFLSIVVGKCKIIRNIIRFILCCSLPASVRLTPRLAWNTRPPPRKLTMRSPSIRLQQVRLLTRFFPFFAKKNLWFASSEQINNPRCEPLYSSVAPCNSLISDSYPWRAFWADMVPFKCPRLTSWVAFGFRNDREKRAPCAAQVAEVPGQSQK